MSSSDSADSSAAKKPYSIKKSRRIFWFIVAAGSISILALAAVLAIARRGYDCGLSIPAQRPNRLDFIGSGAPRDCIYLERTTDSASRALGLAKYDSLPPTQGMLFVFEPSSEACMWMKDMKFAIDMVWLDQSRRVIKIEKNVASDSYPASFCSEQPAQYVVELAAGVADRAGLRVGQQIAF